jgi:hypothetical protein
MKKEVVKTVRASETLPLRWITVYEVWHGLQKLGTFRRRKNARKFAK